MLKKLIYFIDILFVIVQVCNGDNIFINLIKDSSFFI